MIYVLLDVSFFTYMKLRYMQCYIGMPKKMALKVIYSLNEGGVKIHILSMLTYRQTHSKQKKCRKEKQKIQNEEQYKYK